MISVVIVVFAISLGLRMTTYLLPEPTEQVCLVFFLIFYLLHPREILSANVVNGGESCRSRSDMHRIFLSLKHLGLCESESEAASEGTLPRSRQLVRKASAPVGRRVQQRRLKQGSPPMRGTPLFDSPRDSVSAKWSNIRRRSCPREKERPESGETTEHKFISQSIAKRSSTMSDTPETTGLPITPMVPIYHFRMPCP